MEATTKMNHQDTHQTYSISHSILQENFVLLAVVLVEFIYVTSLTLIHLYDYAELFRHL